MKMHEVKSEAMTHIGHDGKDLHVTYRGGKTYKHPNVPQKKFDDLMAAPSKGKFMAASIRPQHPGIQGTTPQAVGSSDLNANSTKAQMVAHLRGNA